MVCFSVSVKPSLSRIIVDAETFPFSCRPTPRAWEEIPSRALRGDLLSEPGRGSPPRAREGISSQSPRGDLLPEPGRGSPPRAREGISSQGPGGDLLSEPKRRSPPRAREGISSQGSGRRIPSQALRGDLLPELNILRFTVMR